MRVITLLTIVALPLAALAQAEKVPAGREIYNAYCLSCHGSDATGLGAFAGDLAAFRVRLANTENMPDMTGILTDEEAAQVFAYVQSTHSR